MDTAAIPYRVADFLKQHPPFRFMAEADLVGLAAHGRVRFHEADEYICWQPSAYGPFVWVIQQGSVSLWDETTSPATLADIRGAGDSIGMERFNGISANPWSARTASDVVLYALNAADLQPLIARYPQAAHYVAAYSAVTPDYSGQGERPRAHEIYAADLVRDRAPVLCPAAAPITEAARLMSGTGSHALALMAEGRLARLLTAADLLQWIADGAQNPQQSAFSVARTPLVTVPPQALVSDCVLAMAEARAAAAALTSDGSPNTVLQSTVTAASLAPAFGDHPVTILQEIATAPNVDSLRNLGVRARAWILDNLSSPAAVGWLARWGDLVNRRILDRLLHLTGNDHPGLLWCFHGAAGRRELLTAEAPHIAVIGTAITSLEIALAECGFLAAEPVVSASLDEWKACFTGWIRDPIRTRVYSSRTFFDLRPVHGSLDIFHELEAHVRAELAAEPAFLRLVANDCLSTLPPLTFFRDLVVEESGERTDTFHLESSAVEPLADVARVFSLASGSPLGASTTERFRKARHLLPAREAIFREAAETMRVMLFHEARAGLRLRTSGAEVPLSILSREDRQVLRSGFHAIHQLLEFTASGEWLEGL